MHAVSLRESPLCLRTMIPARTGEAGPLTPQRGARTVHSTTKRSCRLALPRDAGYLAAGVAGARPPHNLSGTPHYRGPASLQHGLSPRQRENAPARVELPGTPNRGEEKKTP